MVWRIFAVYIRTFNKYILYNPFCRTSTTLIWWKIYLSLKEYCLMCHNNSLCFQQLFLCSFVCYVKYYEARNSMDTRRRMYFPIKSLIQKPIQYRELMIHSSRMINKHEWKSQFWFWSNMFINIHILNLIYPLLCVRPKRHAGWLADV